MIYPKNLTVASRKAQLLAGLSLIVFFAGCSSLQSERIDYKTVSKNTAPGLEIPPDLTALSKETRYNIPGVAITASSFTSGQASASSPIAVNAISDAKIERQGNQRWLLVNRTADQVWSQVREFWLESGFSLNIERQDIGIVETDWAENRAKLPQDFIRNTLGKALNSLYDTGERDKFRTRIERSADGRGTEIYLTHRGLTEQVKKDGTGAQVGTAWEPRASDAELEMEMLRRLMVRLGLPKEQAANAGNSVAPSQSTKLLNKDGLLSLLLDDGFDRAWRRVGLSLDRTGFTVEDRDRAQGVYFVRYVEPIPAGKEPGLFSRLFGSGGKEAAPLKYRIALKSQGDSSILTVLNTAGTAENSQNAERILKVLSDDLR